MNRFNNQQAIQFIELTTDDFKSIRQSLEQLDLRLVAKHLQKEIFLFENNDISVIVNCEMEQFAKEHFQNHGASIVGMGLILDDAEKVINNAKISDYKTLSAADGPTGLKLPSIEGEGGILTYPFTDEQWYSVIKEEFDYEPNQTLSESNISHIDHIAINVTKGQLENWKHFCEVILDMAETSSFIINGKKTSFRCNPMASTCGNIRIVLNEDFEDGSQISEFIVRNNGSGIQHIAFGTNDIYQTVEGRREKAVKFMDTPDTYYDLIWERIDDHKEDINLLRKHKILIDNDKMNTGNILLQIFTDTMIGPIFFEFIQRKGNNGFGEGNVTTLFEAVEMDQMIRGVLA